MLPIFLTISRFVFGLFLAGAVLTFGIVPGLETLADPELDLAPLLVNGPAVAGPLVSFLILGFLWSRPADILERRASESAQLILGGVGALGILGQLYLLGAATLDAVLLPSEGMTEPIEPIIYLSGLTLALFLVSAWLSSLAFWLGYVWVPATLEGTPAEQAESAPAAQAPSLSPRGTGVLQKLGHYGLGPTPPDVPHSRQWRLFQGATSAPRGVSLKQRLSEGEKQTEGE